MSQEDKSHIQRTVREISRAWGSIGRQFRDSVSQVLQEKATADCVHALFSVCSFRDDNVISKPRAYNEI